MVPRAQPGTATGYVQVNHQDPVTTFHLPGRQPGFVTTQIIVDVPAECWPGIMAEVAAAVGRRAAAVREDVYGVILREIPQLRDDKPLLALLASSVDSNVDTCLQI